MTKRDRKGRAKTRRAENRRIVREVWRELQGLLQLRGVRYGDSDNVYWSSPVKDQAICNLVRLARLADQFAIIGAAAHRELDRRYRELRRQRRNLEARMKNRYTSEAMEKFKARAAKHHGGPLGVAVS